MTLLDKINLDRAAFSGDARTMDRAATAICGITRALQNDDIGEDTLTRPSLLVALELVAASLDERAEFVRDEVLDKDDDFKRLCADVQRQGGES